MLTIMFMPIIKIDKNGNITIPNFIDKAEKGFWSSPHLSFSAMYLIFFVYINDSKQI